MIFAKFDEDGFPSGFWVLYACSSIDVIPDDSILITKEQHTEALENPGRRRWVNGALEVYEPPEVQPHTPILYVDALDLWSRMTNEEGEAVGEAMDSQPFRIRKIFETAKTFREDHELWPLLKSMAVSLFGNARADEILAPSNPVTVDPETV